MCSALPCPKGCSSSAGMTDILPPINTTAEETESVSVCQASAVKANDPVTIPAQYLNPKSRMFPMIEIQPSRAMYLSLADMLAKIIIPADRKGCGEKIILSAENERLKDQVKMLDWIERLEEAGPKAKRPLVEYLGKEIYELRIKLSDKESRILYFFMFENAIVLSNGWNKKGVAKKKTEYAKQIKTALKHRKEYFSKYRKLKEIP